MQQGRTTVIVPTTADRGPLLDRSVGSALAQSDENLEVFVIGDGLDDEGIACGRALEARDRRVRFFDFPKDSRRGEGHRHELLKEEASGDTVAYLTDRDLWLPNHLFELRKALAGADFAHTLRFGIGPTGDIEVKWRSDLSDPSVRARHRELPVMAPLSFVGHTMSAYRRLPHGWRTTPEGTQTDRYMWEQFLDQQWCRVGSSPLPTVLYFKRGGHPGLASEERRLLLDSWIDESRAPGFADELSGRVIEALLADRSSLVEERAGRPLERLKRKGPAGAPSTLARLLPSQVAAPLRRRVRSARAKAL